ncbi:MAG TPA: cation:proton antiporter [Acidimicrobiia bacterium]|nr:cation:proton antiporter [Acidimicrobiia bacterium]
MIGLTILAAVFICYSLVAARLDRWSITAPMVFVLTGTLIGLRAPDWLGVMSDPEIVKHIAELTLALLLFADASTLRWAQLRHDGGLPLRLLLIGFPLTVVAGLGAGAWLIPTAGWAAAALAASILAPTDAALGLGVFTNRSVPGRVRRALNVESGLNDGMATPLVTVFLAVLVAAEGSGTENWATEAVRDLAIAAVVAVLVGFGAGRLIAAAHQRQWTSALSQRLAVLASGLLSYAGAVAAGGNGFVAAFVAGLVFAAASGGRLRESVEFTEDLALFASFLVWAIFGGLLVAPQLADGPSATSILYALLSLTLVRMVPVALALIGAGLRPASVLFMGWFGPRGLASVVFTLIAFETLEHEGLASEPLIEIATWTVLLSVIAHGLTAGPLSRWYGRRVADSPAEQGAAGHAGDPMPRALMSRHEAR